MRSFVSGIAMLTQEHRESIRFSPICVISVNTARVWLMDSQDELDAFMRGRNRAFYQVFI